MNTPQIVFLVAVVAALLIWQRVPSVRPVLRLLPAVAIGVIVAPLFVSGFALPHSLLAPALLGGGLAVAVLGLTR